MANIFMKEGHRNFSWKKLGDIKEGRKELGEEMPVVVYRMLEYAINDILTKKFGPEKADECIREAGHLSGSEFAKNVLPLDADFNEFISVLQKKLVELKIGILRIEQFDEADGSFVLTVAEDLDCSGLPPTNEVVCNYDEGFLSGILEAYSGQPYHVREIDCWASGARVCRFKGNVIVSPA